MKERPQQNCRMFSEAPKVLAWLLLQLLGLAKVWLVFLCSFFPQSSWERREQGCEAAGPWHSPIGMHTPCTLPGLRHERERWPGPGTTFTMLSFKHKSCTCLFLPLLPPAGVWLAQSGWLTFDLQDQRGAVGSEGQGVSSLPSV